MTSNFSSILDKPVAEIEAPKPLPPGTYLMTVRGVPRFDKSSQKQTEFVEFTMYPQSYEDDVDEEALAECLTDNKGETRPLSEIPFRVAFYYEKQPHRLKSFLKSLGFDVDDPKANMRQMISEAPNSQVNITVKHSVQGESTRAEMKDHAPAA